MLARWFVTPATTRGVSESEVIGLVSKYGLTYNLDSDLAKELKASTSVKEISRYTETIQIESDHSFLQTVTVENRTISAKGVWEYVSNQDEPRLHMHGLRTTTQDSSTYSPDASCFGHQKPKSLERLVIPSNGAAILFPVLDLTQSRLLLLMPRTDLDQCTNGRCGLVVVDRHCHHETVSRQSADDIDDWMDDGARRDSDLDCHAVF